MQVSEEVASTCYVIAAAQCKTKGLLVSKYLNTKWDRILNQGCWLLGGTGSVQPVNLLSLKSALETDIDK